MGLDRGDREPPTATSTSLLDGLQDPSNQTAWQSYVERYRPTIVRFAERAGAPAADAEDVAQTVLLEFVSALRRGAYARERGRLRNWLYGIAANQVRRWRERGAPPGVRGAEAQLALENAAASDELQQAWEDEWRQAVLRSCLDQVRSEVQPSTLRAFELFVLEERTAQDVARELGTTPNAVFGAKRRVLARIQELLPFMEEIW